jgi:hypothetical protein
MPSIRFYLNEEVAARTGSDGNAGTRRRQFARKPTGTARGEDIANPTRAARVSKRWPRTTQSIAPPRCSANLPGPGATSSHQKTWSLCPSPVPNPRSVACRASGGPDCRHLLGLVAVPAHPTCRIFLAGTLPSVRAVLRSAAAPGCYGVCEATRGTGPKRRRSREAPYPYVSAPGAESVLSRIGDAADERLQRTLQRKACRRRRIRNSPLASGRTRTLGTCRFDARATNMETE